MTLESSSAEGIIADKPKRVALREKVDQPQADKKGLGL
jgi:hypothetical protein